MKRTQAKILEDVTKIREAAEIAKTVKEISILTDLSASQIRSSLKKDVVIQEEVMCLLRSNKAEVNEEAQNKQIPDKEKEACDRDVHLVTVNERIHKKASEKINSILLKEEKKVYKKAKTPLITFKETQYINGNLYIEEVENAKKMIQVVASKQRGMVELQKNDDVFLITRRAMKRQKVGVFVHWHICEITEEKNAIIVCNMTFNLQKRYQKSGFKNPEYFEFFKKFKSLQ